MQQLLNSFRNMFLFRGIAALVFGVIALVWPGLTVLALVILFGIFAIISGITAVATSLQNREVHGWGLLLFEGILWLLAGVVALVWPGITALSFLYLLAVWAVITGMLEIIAPLSFPMSGGRGVLMVLSGLVSIVFGIVIAAHPVSGLLAVTWLIGIYAIIIGVMSVVAYFEARSVAHSLVGSGL
jgi:uncharacterized membrane protein HdeD (DUF308 family)